MIGRIGRDLDHVVHRSLVYNTVLLSRKPAELAGLTALHQFIERGFRAFRHMQGADEFLDEEKLRTVVRHHSDYVPWPVHVGDERANQETALWNRSPSELTDDDYKAFAAALINGSKPNKIPRGHAAYAYIKLWDELAIEKINDVDIIVRNGKKIVVPKKAQPTILQKLHK